MTDGFLNLNKPAGMTSHDAVNIVRKIFSTRKVGHAGTLDPAAQGVLPVAVGRATKFIEFLADSDKSYRAEILFGIATDSGDLDGEIIARAENFTLPPRDALQAVASSFVGEIEQRPPKFSAIKIHGRKAYDLARKNLDFDVPSRRVKIFRMELVALNETSATFDVDCGKGTYIRSLAVDLGAKLALPATLKSLVRLRVGNFNLRDALTIDDAKKIGGNVTLHPAGCAPTAQLPQSDSCPDVSTTAKKIGADCLLPIEFCLRHLPRFELPEHRIRAFLNGLPTTLHAADAQALRIFAGGKFLGVGRIEHGELRSSKII